MTKKTGQPQKKRLADMTIQPEDDRFEPYRLPTGDQSRTAIGNGYRVHLGMWTDGGRMTDFCLTVEVELDDGEWGEAARIDCCHGSVHLHTFTPGKPERIDDLREVRAPEDVTAGYDEGVNMIFDKAPLYVRRWTGGR